MMGAGPRLPFEFSRISPKRKHALAVCLDPDHGDHCPTNAIVSLRRDIHEAAEDLRARERAQDVSMIGAYCARTGFGRSRLPDVGPAFEEWCLMTGAAGVVWTDLDRNYEDRRGEAFSVPRASAYLRSLTGESLEEAVRYIEYAPEATDTPLRRALREETWWREAARRFT